MSVRISNILNTLILKGSQGQNNEVDEHLKNIIKRIEKEFQANNIPKVLEWYHACVKKEQDLKKKVLDNPFVYKKPNIKILILKTNVLHSKIIEMLVERIDKLAERGDVQSKMIAVDLANTFIANFSVHRSTSELIYDQAIKIISDSIKIFTNA